MAEGRGTFDNPAKIGIADLFADASGHLRKHYSSTGEPMDAASEGESLVTNPFHEDVDANSKLIKNLFGFGGAAGDAVKIVSTYAELEAACEDATTFLVLCLEGTYTGSTTITATSGTYILGLGHVQFDWSGSAGGQMFNNGASTRIALENIHFVNSGNSYYNYLGTGYIRLYNVIADYSTSRLFLNGSYNWIYNCHLGHKVYFQNAAVSDLHCYHSTFENSVLFYRGTRFYVDRCFFDYSSGKPGYLLLNGNGAMTEIHVDHCDFIGAGFYGIVFSGTASHENIKITNNTISQGASRRGIEITTALTIDDLWIANNTFRDMSTGKAYNFSAGTLNRPRFINNRYDNIGTVYYFTGATINNPVYCMDGN